MALVLEATEGGTRRHLLDLCRGLPVERFEVVPIVSVRPGGGFDADIQELGRFGVRVEILPMRRRPAPLADLVSLLRLIRLLRRERPNVVHTHGSKGGLFGRIAARWVGVPLVFHTAHVYPFQWSGKIARMAYLWVERIIWRLADKIVAVGPGQAHVAIKCKVADESRLITIPNGVNAEEIAALASSDNRYRVRAELGLGSENLAVGMVARLSPQKGCGHFLRAAGLVARSEPRARFFLIGSGPLESRLRALAAELGLADRVRFLGHRQDAGRLYAGLDLFVLSSLWEGLPYAILEAQAAGLAVVASRIPGCEELVDEGLTGFLVPLQDEGQIAERVTYLLKNPAKRAKMGLAARASVARDFRLDRFLELHSRLYEGSL